MIKKNIIYNLLGQFCPVLFVLIAYPILIENLGIEKFGLLSLLLLFINILIIFDFGISRAIIKYISEDLNNTQNNNLLISNALLIQIFVGIIGCLFLILCSKEISSSILKISQENICETQTSFIYISLILPCILLNNTFRGILEAFSRFDIINIIRVVFNSMQVIVPVLLVINDIINIAIIILAVGIIRYIQLLVFILVIKKILPLDLIFSFEIKVIRKLFKFGKWILISSIISPFLVQSEKIIIGSLIMMEAVSYYAGPSDFVKKLLIVPASIVSVMFPEYNRLNSGDDSHIKMFNKINTSILLIMGLFVLLLSIYSTEIFHYWLGASFIGKSDIVFKILLIGLLFNPLSWNLLSFIQAKGRPDLPSKAHLIELPIHIFLLIFLTYKYGIFGSALAWTLRMVFDYLLLSGFIHKLNNITLIFRYLPYQLAAITFIIIISNLTLGLFMKLAFAILIVLVHLVLLSKYVLKDYINYN